MIMNRFDIDDALYHYENRHAVEAELPNYRTAARILAALMRWTDENSDGWPYWSKPSTAANRLQSHLRSWRERYTAGIDIDLTDDELRDIVRPVKAFLTRTARENGAHYPDHASSALNLRERIAKATA